MTHSRFPRARALARAAAALAVAGAALLTTTPAHAGAGTTLTITPLGWNIVGLDSNDPVNSGPDTFPIGARVCNTGTQAADVDVTWAWSTANSYVTVDAPLTATRTGMAAGDCEDVYYPVLVTRDAAAFGTSRSFQISASAANAATVTTPANREVYIESLVSQNRNSITSITGVPAVGVVGQQLTITVVGATATGYEQLTSMLNLDGSIFRIDSVSTTYEIPASGTNDQFYADACGWVADTTAVNYRACGDTIPSAYASSSGKAGGAVTYVVHATVIGTGSTTVSPVFYDYSGSSFHYTMDPGKDVAFVAIGAPSITKTDVSRTAAAAVGDTITYDIDVTNTAGVALTNVSVTDANASIGTCTPAIPVATLAVDATIECFATHVVTQADMDAGEVRNTAVLSSSYDGSPLADVDSSEVVTQLAQHPAIGVQKTDVSGAAPTAAGQTVTYQIVATNTGDVTLHDVNIVDDNAVIGSCTPVIPVASLAPGASITCTATHAVTPAEVAAGKVDNTALATSDEVQAGAASNMVTTVIESAPVLPSTGRGDGRLAWLAAALLAAGAALVAMGRRRITH